VDKDLIEDLHLAKMYASEEMNASIGYYRDLGCVFSRIIDGLEATEQRTKELEEVIETTKKNLENWSRGASQQKWISIFNAEIVYLRKSLRVKEE